MEPSRRRFLWGLAGAAAGLAVPPRAPAAPRSGLRVIVIGAGVAGLTAAHALRQHGLDAVVLEARPRLGGRVWTDRSLGTAVDLGAGRIRGARGNPILQLARRYGFRTTPLGTAVSAYDDAGKPVPAERLARARHRHRELRAALVQRAAGRAQDASAGSVWRKLLADAEIGDVDERRTLAWVARHGVVESGAELDELSLLHAGDATPAPGGDLLLPGGYDQIVGALAARADVRLEHRVDAVHWGREGVRVATSQGELAGEAVVVTLPLGVLQAGIVAFDPPLPASTRHAIGRLGVGVVDKVALRFPRLFWSLDADFLGHIAEPPGTYPLFLNLRMHAPHPVLVALTGGRSAREAEDRSDAEIVAELMTRLRRAHGPHIPEPESVRVTRWARDPFARGSGSYLPPGATGADYDALAELHAGGCLLFAGEATARTHPATVHGAYLSGLRAASQLLQHRLEGTSPA